MWPSFCPQPPIDPAHYSDDGNTPTNKTFSPSFQLSGYVQVGKSKWHRCRQGGEWLRTLPPLVGIGVASIRGVCPRSRGLLAEASALAGVRMLAHIPLLASVGVTSSIGAGLSWRAVWAMGIQGGCTCQLFLLNSIFENLGAYGGPSGPQGSRAAVPASRSSSTPSLGIWGLMEGATTIHWNAAATRSPARHHSSARRPMGGGACGEG